jgi:hypothetical protein
MQVPLTQQILSFAAALLILVAYIAHQAKRMDSGRSLYNVLNAAGSAVLAWAALHPLQWGFLVLEGTWCVVSVIALLRAMRAGKEVPST